ncbi:pentapeptide repeat-containing protein [Maricaulis sp. MIT060901]|uniref:pentapeptide repeat-containing protein n=1 Tax=Maricaulis sp. MIT060901 TaxID=3096993 RepID=UPI00399C4727
MSASSSHHSDDDTEEPFKKKDWKDLWWGDDYSWLGLSAKLWIGWSVTPSNTVVETERAPADSRVATLQDYFRWDTKSETLRDDAALTQLNLLQEAPNGWLFHVLHLPVYSPEGDPTWKNDPEDPQWDTVEAEVASLIARGAETRIDGSTWQIDGPDRRSQILGCVIKTLPFGSSATTKGVNTELHINAHRSAFLQPVDASRTTFGHGTSFHGAQFYEAVDFSEATFDGSASFQEVGFGNGATFDKVEFKGRCPFTLVKFDGFVAFRNACFCHEVSFLDTTFEGVAFTGTRFEGNASFQQVRFNDVTNFSKAVVLGKAIFWSAKFDGASNFASAEFAKGVDFNIAKFHAPTDFVGVKFCGPALFERTSFVERAEFWDTNFAGNADFSGASFGDAASSATVTLNHNRTSDAGRTYVSFQNAVFSKAAYLIGCTFYADVNFRGALFKGPAFFGDANLGSESINMAGGGATFSGHTSFRGATFEALSVFAGCVFPDETEKCMAMFEGTRFYEPLDFKSVRTLPFSAFQGIRLKDGILLDLDHPKQGQFEQALKTSPDATTLDHEPGGSDDRNQSHFASLEAGCRMLKHAMSEESDRRREQKFYRFELQAREHRRDLPTLSRQFTQLYGTFSEYGESAAIPLRHLGTLTILSWLILLDLALFFGGFGSDIWATPHGINEVSPLHPTFMDICELAITNALGPFRLVLGSGTSFEHLNGSAPIFGFTVLIVSALQSLASSVLIFLSLLALRRKFQIN